MRVCGRATDGSYLVRYDEPQAVFTGKQQRDGVSIMPFLVAGIWRLRFQHHVQMDEVESAARTGGRDGTSGIAADDGDSSVPDLAARVAALSLNEPAGVTISNLPSSILSKRAAVFDWPAYRAVWNNTPVDEAITAMFAEFAVLHAELCGYVCSCAPPPLTLDTGKHIADRAERFVTMYVTPILGPQHSTKVHKLMCHVMDAIRMHGNINNGNSGINESMHKEDKPYYARTNKDMEDFTRQLIVQAQGARTIQQRVARRVAAGAESGGLAGAEESSSSSDSDADHGGSRGGGSSGAVGENAAVYQQGRPLLSSSPAAAATGTTAAVVSSSAHHLRSIRLSTMARLPGLAGVAAALNLPEHAFVRVLSRIEINAVFDCGWTTKQLLYASPCFRRTPWYDFVLYHPTEDRSVVSVAEVRAIVRRPEGDFAVMAEMDVVQGVPRCPFIARGCTRLAWRVADGHSDVCLQSVPVASIRRVLHVVPDFGDVVKRLGVEARPAVWTDPVEERLAMRFFINAFYPWGP